MNIDGVVTLDRNQAMLIFSHPNRTIKAGVRAPWATTEVEVVGVDGDKVQIRRVAFDSVALPNTDAAPQTMDSFTPLNAFDDGVGKNPVDKGATLVIEVGPDRDQGKNPGVDPRVLYPGKNPGGGVEYPGLLPGGDEKDMTGVDKGDKVVPGYFTNAPIANAARKRSEDEAREILNSLKAARIHDGLKDEPLMAVVKETK